MHSCAYSSSFRANFPRRVRPFFKGLGRVDRRAVEDMNAADQQQDEQRDCCRCLSDSPLRISAFGYLPSNEATDSSA